MAMLAAKTETGFTTGFGEVPVALGAMRSRLLEVTSTLDAADWDRPSRCERWTVHDVIRHVRDACRLHTRRLQGLAEAGLFKGFDARTTPARWLERTAGEHPAETVEDLRRLADDEATALSARLAGPGAEVVTGPYGKVHWTILTTHVLWDAWLHVGDVAGPLGLDTPSTPVEDEVVGLYALLIASVPAMLMGRPCDATVGLATEDGQRLSATVRPGRVSLQRGAPLAGEDLRGDLKAVVDSLSGRGPELEAVLHGDPAAREPLTWLRPMLAGADEDDAGA